MLLVEICRPLGIADSLFVGIPDEVEPRVAILEDITKGADDPVPEDSGPASVPAWMQPLHSMMNRPDARRACIPASNGIMTARAVARHYAALLPGGVDGIELLPPDARDWRRRPSGPAKIPRHRRCPSGSAIFSAETSVSSLPAPPPSAMAGTAAPPASPIPTTDWPSDWLAISCRPTAPVEFWANFGRPLACRRCERR